MRSKVAFIGAACYDVMAESSMSSVLSTARPNNMNFPVPCWMNIVFALSSGGDSSGYSVYCALAL